MGEEEAVQQVSLIQLYFVKQLLVGCLQQLFERRQVRRTVAAALAAIEKCVYSLSVGRSDEAGQSTGCVLAATLDITSSLSVLSLDGTLEQFTTGSHLRPVAEQLQEPHRIEDAHNEDGFLQGLNCQQNFMACTTTQRVTTPGCCFRMPWVIS